MGSLGQLLIITIIQSKFWTCKWQCFKAIKTPTRLNILSISIWDPKIPRTYLARKPTFGNLPSWVFHQTSGFAHIDGGIANLWNKNNSPITNVNEDSSTHAPTPNMLVFFSIGSSSIETTTSAWMEGFNLSKIVIRSGMTSFKSYLDARRIAFPRPT